MPTDQIKQMKCLMTLFDGRPARGATYVGPPSWTWTFPSGAKIRLAYISTDKDIWEYLGPRYSFIGFDESTFHSEYQIRNMLGRLSSTDKTCD